MFWRQRGPLCGGAVLFTATLLACGGSGTPQGERPAPAAEERKATGGKPSAGAPSSGGPPAGARRPGGGRPGGFPGMMGMGGGDSVAAVPVEVAPVSRRAISSYIETNGTLEAEYEVDIVARTSGPVVKLLAEEGDRVRKGQVLASLDENELRAQVEIARVALNESRQAFQRAQTLKSENLISPESYDQAKSNLEASQAQFDAAGILLDYATVRAPFDGFIIRRDVDMGEQVTSNMSLFRISDFEPLLCPIQVPERELRQLRQGQSAYLTVEPFPEQRFQARVLRISPVVDAATGTIKVTLEVQAENLLRPGMFARVFLETATREAALVVPKKALSLESIGDTVYVAGDEKASRREVELGYKEGDFVEITSGVAEGELVVVVGQDGLSDGTPVRILAGAPASAEGDGETGPAASAASEAGPGAGAGRPGGPPFDLSKATPEQLERLRSRMRERGLSEEQIEERLRQARQRTAGQGS